MSTLRNSAQGLELASNWEATLLMKLFGAAPILWSINLLYRSLESLTFSFPSVAFHFILWMAGICLIYLPCQFAVDTGGIRWRRFVNWKSVPLDRIETFRNFWDALRVLSIAFNGKHEWLLFRVPLCPVGGQELEVERTLKELPKEFGRLVVYPNPGKEGGLQIPAIGRPHSGFQVMVWFRIATLVGIGFNHIFDAAFADGTDRGLKYFIWLFSIKLVPTIAVGFLIKSLILNWSPQTGTGNLRVKSDAAIAILLMGYLFGIVLGMFDLPFWRGSSMFPLRPKDILLVAIVSVFVALFALNKMIEEVSCKTSHFRNLEFFGIVEFFQVKELHREMFPDSLSNTLLDVFLPVAAIAFGLCFFIFASIISA